MKKPPIVTIIGRQNVGKSTLFNLLAGKKGQSITFNTPGVTRDVLEVIVTREDIEGSFILRDTPGLDILEKNELSSEIIDIVTNHLKESNVILYVFDKRDIREFDFQFIENLRKSNQLSSIPIIFIANKSDSIKDEEDLDEFYRMGLKEIIPISALSRKNIHILTERINSLLPKKGRNVNLIPDIKIAIVGKPNSGKSSLVNAILGYKRSVVSEIPGTTRDSVHSYFKYKENLIQIIDTAGIRKKSKSAQGIEFYSYRRTFKAMDEADIIIFLLDANKGFGEYDKKIFSYLEENGKPAIIAFNKWDSIPDKTNKTFQEFKERVFGRFPAMVNKPFITISATTKLRIANLLDLILEIKNKLNIKIPTSELNEKLKSWMSNPIVSRAKRSPKIRYATQISSHPFQILCFVNSKELFTPNIISFLKKKFNQEYQLMGMPIEIEIRDNEEGHRN